MFNRFLPVIARALPAILAGFCLVRATTTFAAEKPRVLVLTDIENEPDDAMSLVRFLVYSNQWDVEGLVATTSIHQKSRVAPQRIRQIVSAYAKVRDNLELHEPGFPTGDYLLARVSEGLPVYGMNGVGEGKDSPASELLIRAVDRDDPRPLWVPVWGGPSVLAQALWKVRATRSAPDLARFVSRLRVYTISDQDDSGPWIRQNFPGVFYIASPGFSDGGAYHHATWSGISGDYFHARCPGADFQLVTNEWLDRNIRRKGPLGAEYPRWEYLMEGDTPSFLNLIANGLSDPEHPNWGGWGGRYELYTPRPQKWHLYPETRPLWTDADDEVLGVDGRWHDTNHATIWRWRSAYQNDFAARMDWTVKPYAAANHPPVPRLGHSARLTARPGQRVDLSAEGTSDPDGDAVSYEWFYYNEAGTFPLSSARSGQPLEIKNYDQPKAWFTVPTGRVMPPGLGEMHIILAVTDHGTPRLTRYQRVIVTVVP
ncbi:MAG TPA: nucleoside hydrolase-like domain-containing protein [Opitutaceae bacterium]|nr:nucleoside hydrolase-like domain-containing protein [Opitutaceae bacterium]